MYSNKAVLRIIMIINEHHNLKALGNAHLQLA
jgi:hypothetical protein